MIRVRRPSEGAPAGPSAASGNVSLLTCDQMRRIMHRERIRSDRSRSMFCLVTFTFPQRLGGADHAALAVICGRRLRCTDDAGVMSPTRLGIVLPETDVAARGCWQRTS